MRRAAIDSIFIEQHPRMRRAIFRLKVFLPETTEFSHGKMSRMELGKIRISFADSKIGESRFGLTKELNQISS